MSEPAPGDNPTPDSGNNLHADTTAPAESKLPDPASVQPTGTSAPTESKLTDPASAQPTGIPPLAASDSILPLVVYILYLLCYFASLPVIIGVVIAYTARAGSTPLHSEHYRFQIRTFWIALLYSLIVTLVGLTIVLFPLAILLGSLVVLWVIIRSVRGLVSLQRKETPHNPDTWLY